MRHFPLIRVWRRHAAHTSIGPRRYRCGVRYRRRFGGGRSRRGCERGTHYRRARGTDSGCGTDRRCGRSYPRPAMPRQHGLCARWDDVLSSSSGRRRSNGLATLYRHAGMRRSTLHHRRPLLRTESQASVLVPPFSLRSRYSPNRCRHVLGRMRAARALQRLTGSVSASSSPRTGGA
jgi:hypothetical protein